jgi:hypothetical protein
MQNVEEGGDSITSSLANLCLFNQSLIKERGCILLLLLATIATGVFAFSLLLRRYTGDIESHLNQLILARTSLLALASSTAQLAVGASVVGVEGQGELQGNLIPTRQVCVSNLRVGQLKGRAVLDVEGDFGFGELGLAPVPSPQRMLLALERGAVPVLEDLAQALVVLLLESVELDDARVALQDADLVAPGGAAPLGATDVAVIEGEGVTAADGFPSKAGLCESALAALLGEVKVDAVETLTV